MSIFNLFKKKETPTLPEPQELHPLPENILPVLQAHTWPGKSQSLTRSLCYLPKLGGTPWLSFGFDAGPVKAYASEGSMKLWGVTAEELEAIAIQNMRHVSASWEGQELTLPDQTVVKTLICQSDGLIGERMIDKAFMQAAHEYLAEDLLTAIVPSRGLLIVTPFSGGGPTYFSTMLAVMEGVTVSNWVFTIQGGSVTGRVAMENGQLVVDHAFMA
jgi:hypothetical protein